MLFREQPLLHPMEVGLLMEWASIWSVVHCLLLVEQLKFLEMLLRVHGELLLMGR